MHIERAFQMIGLKYENKCKIKSMAPNNMYSVTALFFYGKNEVLTSCMGARGPRKTLCGAGGLDFHH